MRRMDRYKDASPEENISRAQMNKELYENIGNNTRYTDIADVTTSNEIDLSSRRNSRTREGYHQMKEYQDVVPIPRVKKELEEFKNIYKDKENKIYDINTILEEARKNRHEKDSKEEKRKLKNDTYNILANLNNDELEKLRQERKDRLRKSVSEEDDLFENADNEEIVDDLAAASELLGDLMATNVLKKISIEKETDDDDDDLKLEKTISEEDFDTSDKQDDEEKEEHEDEIDIDEVSTEDSDEDESEDEESSKEEDEEDESDDDDDDKTFIDEDKLTLSREIEDLKLLKKLDNLPKENPDETDETEEDESDDDDEMYTKTMDLSEMDLEIDEEFKEKKLPFGLKILIILIILVVLACVYLFFWKTI